MSVLLFSNNASTTIAGGITSTALAVNLAPGSGVEFPNPSAGQYFVGTFTDAATGLLNEIVWVTARSGDTLTIVRAQESTTARAWTAGDLFSNLWTAGQAAQMVQQGQIGSAALINYGVDTGTADNMVVTLSPTVTALADGLIVEVTPAYANTTTTPVINPSGLGNKNIVRFDGSAVKPGDFQPAPAKFLLAWSQSALQFQLLNPAQLLTAAVTNSVQFGTPGSTTWTCPAGKLRANVTVTGGGGGGAGCAINNSGGNGGAGGTAVGWVNTTPGTVYTIVVGSAGTGGASGGTNAGGAGGTSSALGLSATGGGGGGVGGVITAGGAGGTASGGTTNLNGGYGSDNVLISAGGTGGSGGCSFWGGGGRGGNAGGIAGQAPGSGGGGSYATAGAGAAGAAGLVVIQY